MTATIKQMELAQIGVLIAMVVALGAFYVTGVAAVAPIIVGERITVALMAAGPDAFQWAGSLVPFPTGPPTSPERTACWRA